MNDVGGVLFRTMRVAAEAESRVDIRLAPCDIRMVANSFALAVYRLTNANDLSVGAWAKRCYFSGRALMDERLRPFDLGATQWYVLWYLDKNGPSLQRDIGHILEIERATLSGIIATLARKGLIAQCADGRDQRQRLLNLTVSGQALWQRLPDLSFIHEAAFGDIKEADLATTVRVLALATERLQMLLRKD